MTEHQFDAKLKEIEQQYAQHREGADAYRDQELARLFNECGWGQERIAHRMGQAISWVSRRLLFGRFIAFLPSGQNCKLPPHPLTERRFRDNWSRAGKRKKETEEERFARVLELLKADRSEMPKNYGNLVKKPGIKKAVAEILSDGQRRTTPEIAELVSDQIPGTDAKQVMEAIKLIRKQPPKGMALDERHTGRTHKYRLVERKRAAVQAAPVDPEAAGVVAAEALPLIKQSIHILRQPEVGRQTTLALEHLWRVEQMLKRLLVPEEVA